MRIIRLSLVALSFAVLSMSYAQAAPQENIAVAKEFIEVTKSGDTLKDLLPIMTHNFVAAMNRDNPQKTEKVNELVNKTFIPALAAHLPEMNDKLAEIYAEHLTIDDMRQLIAFYKTPVGQKYLQTRPVIMTETMKAATVWSHDAVKDAVQKLTEEMKKNNLQIPKEMGVRTK